MPDWHHLRVRNEREVGHYSEVWLDGIKLKGVTDISIRIGSNDANRVTIEMLVGSVNKPDDKPIPTRPDPGRKR